MLSLKHKTYLEQQILKISAQLNKSFSKYLFSKTGFGKPLIFQLLPLVFDSWHGSTELFIFAVSPLNARSDHVAKLFAGQLSNGLEYRVIEQV